MGDAKIRDLIERVSTGDEAAARELAERYEPQLRANIHGGIGKNLRARLATSDVLQSAMLTALGEMKRFEYRGEPAFIAWLNAITERKILMAARYHSALKRDVRRERYQTLEPALGPDAQPSPSQGAVEGEVTELIGDAVTRLPTLERRVVRLHTFEGWTFARVSEELGLSGQARARYIFQRALKMLGRALDDRI